MTEGSDAPAAVQAEGTGANRLFDLARALRIREALLMVGFPAAAGLLTMPEFSVTHLTQLATMLFCLAWTSLSVYAANAWAGYEGDVIDPKFEGSPQHLGRVSAPDLLWVMAVTLGLGLAWFQMLLPRFTFAALGLWLVWIIYSHPRGLKRLPFTGTLLHLVGGMIMALLPAAAYGPLDGRSWVVASVLTGAFASGHLNHEILDHSVDAANGMWTTAGLIGRNGNHVLGLMMVSAAYGAALVGAQIGFLSIPEAVPFLVAWPVHLFLGAVCWRRGLERPAVVAYRRSYRWLFATAAALSLAARL